MRGAGPALIQGLEDIKSVSTALRAGIRPGGMPSRMMSRQYRPALLGRVLASTGLDLTLFCNPHS